VYKRQIFDIPSSHRRKLFGHTRRDDWHGNTALRPADVTRLSRGLFSRVSTTGILFLPVHRLPASWRKSMVRFDLAMASGPMKVLSSYLIFELAKI